MPLFSLIIPYHQLSNRDTDLYRICHCLSQQTFRDFEALIYHDGPFMRPQPVPPGFEVRCTEADACDQGQAVRDRGMREASGEWVWTVNADNVIYPDALETLAGAIRGTQDVDVWAVPVWEFKYCAPRKQHLSGELMRIGSVDALQVIARRSCWRAVGAWADRSPESDGRYAEKLAERFKWRTLRCDPLGEHW